MRILVTGGAGFIGSHIVEHFSGNAQVRVLDNLRTGYLRNVERFDVEFIEGSVTNRDVVRRAVKDVDYVFHLAAMISVPESMEKPTECVEINTLGTLILLEEAAKAGVKKLCFSSSAAVYGDNPVIPKTEKMLPEPKSPYAVTKIDGEYYCKIFADEGWLDTACLRYFNVFGPRQDPNSQYAAAIPIFIHKAVRDETLTIFGDGQQTRDFIYVKDIVSANVYLATNEGYSGVFNAAYGQRQTIQEIAEKIIELTGSMSKIEYGPVRAGDVKHSQASVDNLLNTGFKSQWDFSDGLAKTIDFFRNKIA
jgi:UDP-glucose 4-epimerase